MAGLIGPAGRDGIDGLAGLIGPAGRDGIDGLHGKDGLPGASPFGLLDTTAYYPLGNVVFGTPMFQTPVTITTTTSSPIPSLLNSRDGAYNYLEFPNTGTYNITLNSSITNFYYLLVGPGGSGGYNPPAAGGGGGGGGYVQGSSISTSNISSFILTIGATTSSTLTTVSKTNTQTLIATANKGNNASGGNAGSGGTAERVNGFGDASPGTNGTSGSSNTPYIGGIGGSSTPHQMIFGGRIINYLVAGNPGLAGQNGGGGGGGSNGGVAGSGSPGYFLLYFPRTPNVTITPQSINFADGTQQTTGNIVTSDTNQIIDGLKSFNNPLTICSTSTNISYTGTVNYTIYNPYTQYSETTPSGRARWSYYQWTANGSMTYSGPPATIYYIIVGGGGGGGAGSSSIGGGGGAGGQIFKGSMTITSGTYNIVIGNGGTSGQSGNQSSFNTLVASGGAAGTTTGGIAVSGSGSGGAPGVAGSYESGTTFVDSGFTQSFFAGGGGGGTTTSSTTYGGPAGGSGGASGNAGSNAAANHGGGGGGGGSGSSTVGGTGGSGVIFIYLKSYELTINGDAITNGTINSNLLSSNDIVATTSHTIGTDRLNIIATDSNGPLNYSRTNPLLSNSVVTGFRYYYFTSSGFFTITGPSINIYYIIVGPGGSGGNGSASYSGGGGAGGQVHYGSATLTTGSHGIQVGSGGFISVIGGVSDSAAPGANGNAATTTANGAGVTNSFTGSGSGGAAGAAGAAGTNVPFYDGNTGLFYTGPGGGGGGSSTTTATSGGNSSGISKGGNGGTNAAYGSIGTLGGGGGGGGTNSKSGGAGGNGFILIYFNPYELYVNGETTLNGALQVNSTITSSSTITGTTLTTSDYRIKDNVEDLDLEIYKTDNLRPVSYLNKLSKKSSIGLIAHELQEQYPFLVFGEKDGANNQAVDYIGLIAILIKEIQQLKTVLKNNNLT